MVSSDGFRGLMFLVVKVRAGWGGHDRVGPLGVPEGMLLLGHAVPLVVMGGGGAGSSFIGQPGWGRRPAREPRPTLLVDRAVVSRRGGV